MTSLTSRSANARHFALLAGLTVLFAACGVRFRDPEPGTEFFTDLAVSGDLKAQAPLAVSVQYEQFYPVEVEMVCELRQHKTTLKEIGRQLVQPLENGSPDATPVSGNATFDLTVDAPGQYTVECLTPKDEDNYISKKISVAAS
jgi:hypothetical protein